MVPFKYHELPKPTKDLPEISKDAQIELFKHLLFRKMLDFTDAINDCKNKSYDDIIDAINKY